jgi:hypothetical protein
MQHDVPPQLQASLPQQWEASPAARQPSTAALGAYLETLRRGRRRSRAWVANLVTTSGTHLWRIENGRVETGCVLLVQLLMLLGGSLPHAAYLLLDPDATVADGIRLAQRALADEAEDV